VQLTKVKAFLKPITHDGRAQSGTFWGAAEPRVQANGVDSVGAGCTPRLQVLTFPACWDALVDGVAFEWRWLAEEQLVVRGTHHALVLFVRSLRQLAWPHHHLFECMSIRAR
jgi:hypothetical protein